MTIRTATATDLDFIRNSWRDSYRMSHMAGPIPMNRYRAVYDDLIGQLLARDGVQVLVAYIADHAPPNDAFGWLCIEHGASAPARVRENGRWTDGMSPLTQPLVHYVYVKQPFRRHHIARSLFVAAGVDVARHWVHTFSTAIVPKIRHTRDWGGVFDPRLARFPKNEPMEASE